MRLLIISIILTLPNIFTFGQNKNITSKSMTKLVTGKWKQTKTEGYFTDTLERISSNDVLELGKRGNYIWVKDSLSEKGKWKIDCYSKDNETNSSECLLDFEDLNGTSNGAIEIFSLTNNELILRTYRLVGKRTKYNYIDLYFLKAN